MRNRDIVMTGLQNFYGESGSNAVNIAWKFAEKNRVLYVNYPLDRSTVLRHRKNPGVAQRLQDIKAGNSGLKKAAENLWVLNPPVILESVSRIPYALLFNFLTRINNKRYAKAIRGAMDELGMQNIVLFEDSDIYRTVYLKELLSPRLFVYYSRDNMTATRFYRHHGKRMEKEIMAKADAVLCNSQYLADLASQHNPRSFNVGQGVDLSLFREQESLGQGTEQTVIGYAGALNANRLDIDLISHLAKAKPEWKIELVGPEDESFKNSELHNLSNVVFRGKQPMDTIPAFIQQWDVTINPQQLNDVTIGNYPRKIDEYLAMGKPVVAVETETMKMFEEVVFLAGDYEEFVEACERALLQKNENTEKRKTVARSHTWDENIKRIYEVIEQIEKQKQ